MNLKKMNLGLGIAILVVAAVGSMSSVTHGQVAQDNDIQQTLQQTQLIEEQRKQQESIFNITRLWEDAGLIDFDRDEFNPLYVPATVNYQTNDTIVLFNENLGSRLWGAVEVLKEQGFEVKQVIVSSDEMVLNPLSEGDFDIHSDYRILLERAKK